MALTLIYRRTTIPSQQIAQSTPPQHSFNHQIQIQTNQRAISRVRAYLTTLCCSQTPHDVQLRCFRNTVRHGASTRGDPCYAARHEEHSTLGIGVESWSGGAEEQRLRLDVYGEAGVPVGGRGGVQIGEW